MVSNDLVINICDLALSSIAIVIVTDTNAVIVLFGGLRLTDVIRVRSRRRRRPGLPTSTMSSAKFPMDSAWSIDSARSRLVKSIGASVYGC